MFTQVFIGGAIYPFLLYLLLKDVREIQETTYFFINGDALKEALVRGNIKHYHCFFSRYPLGFSLFSLYVLLFRGISVVWWRIFSRVCWPFLRGAKIYAVDTVDHALALIGKRKYTYLDDGLRSYAPYRPTCRFGRVRRFLLGTVANNRLGRNPQVEKIVLTGLAKIPDAYEGKNVEVVSMEKLWQDASYEKKNFLLKMFDLGPEILSQLRERDIVFLDHPLACSGLMTEAEQIELVRKVLEPYDASRVSIKVHYRNPIDYTRYFPGVCVWGKSTPMELANFCGVRFSKAMMVVSSTAAKNFPYDIEMEYLGANLDNPCFAHLSGASRRKLNAFFGRSVHERKQKVRA